jgi:uncharacterized protein (TIGR02453 family)
MADGSDFSGFPPEGVQFLIQLRQNNNREWFRAHQQDYEQYLLEPARVFVVAMGDRLAPLAPGIHADPRTDQSIFRIHRDTRFSPDKSPYKTHLGIFFWEGPSPKMNSSGLYFHLEPPNIMVGVGNHHFPDEQLPRYREAVIDPERGPALETAIQAGLSSGRYTLGGPYYKRVPKGYDPAGPRSALLLYNSMWMGQESDIPEVLYTAGFVDYCLQVFRDLLPLQRWIMDVMAEADS